MTLEVQVGDKLKKLGLTLASAESCTGGLIGDLLTNVAGSSEYFWGGVISYDTTIKQKVLGVSQSIIETVGVVSAECALAMAMGVRVLMQTDLAISTTGIAGPGGALPNKPIGTVFVALVDNKGYSRCERFWWQAERTEVKRLAAVAALQMILDYQ